MIVGSYRCDRGQIVVHHGQERTDIASATPRQVLALRKNTIGYVSQFLRAIPRVPTLDVVAEPLIAGGVSMMVGRIQPAGAWPVSGEGFSLTKATDFIGKELGVSDWVTMGQDRIDQFAECTGDHQWIHVDPERARSEPDS